MYIECLHIFFLLLILTIPLAYADSITLTATVLDSGQAGGDGNDQIILEDNENLDLTLNVVQVDETTETIGGIEVDLTQEVEFVATGGDVVTLINTQLTSVTVEIPDRAVVSASAAWDKQLTPPKSVSTSGTVATGFQTPTTAIEVGSPNVILVFDKAVTIILTGTTGQTAYKLPGQTSWTLISTCTGTFASPNDPPTNGECSITDGTDTKILTFHFTEFTGLEETVIVETTTETTTESTTTTSSNGGSGRVGVGPSSGSSGGSGFKYVPPTTSEDATSVIEGVSSASNTVPLWIQDVIFWWSEDKITDQEFKNIITYLLDENVIPNDTPKPQTAMMDLAPSTKHIFTLWANGQIPESSVTGIINYYRNLGVW